MEANLNVMVGEEVGQGVLNCPMTYIYYHLVKRGTTPKTAPVYIEEEEGGN